MSFAVQNQTCSVLGATNTRYEIADYLSLLRTQQRYDLPLHSFTAQRRVAELRHYSAKGATDDGDNS